MSKNSDEKLEQLQKKIIKRICKLEADTLDFYDYKKSKETPYDPKVKDYSFKGRSIGFMFKGRGKKDEVN